MPAQVKVTLDPVNPETPEIIAASIIEIAASMKKLNDSRLTRKAILVLVCADTGIGKGIVNTVLESLAGLEHTYVRPDKRKK